MPDDHSEVVPLLPIPNRTVKHLRADDSAGSRVKVGHRQALITKPPNPSKGWAFCFGKTKSNATPQTPAGYPAGVFVWGWLVTLSTIVWSGQTIEGCLAVGARSQAHRPWRMPCEMDCMLFILTGCRGAEVSLVITGF